MEREREKEEYDERNRDKNVRTNDKYTRKNNNGRQFLESDTKMKNIRIFSRHQSSLPMMTTFLAVKTYTNTDVYIVIHTCVGIRDRERK